MQSKTVQTVARGATTAWNYAPPGGGITTNAQTTAKAAVGAGKRNYCTSFQLQNASATVATEFIIQDGAAGAILWRGFVDNMAAGSLYPIAGTTFDPPLQTSANTALTFTCVTTGAAVYPNFQGYTD